MSISLFGLLILIPITVSLKFSGGIGFDRIGGFNNPAWIISVPISIFFGLWLVSRYFNIIIGKKNILLLSLMVFFVILIKTIYIGQIDYSILKILLSILMFIFFTFAFVEYFKKKLITKSDINGIENAYILYPLALILFATIISWQFSYHFLELRSFKDWQGIPVSGVPIFLSTKIVIYDFEQYFAFIFTLMIASASRLRIFPYIVLSIVGFYCVRISGNSTATLTILIIIMFNFAYSFLDSKSRTFSYKVTSISIVLLPAMYLIFMFFLYDDLGLNNSGLNKRYSMISGYFNELQWYQVLFPFLSDARPLAEDLHNEFLEVFNAFSFIGLLMFYLIILRLINSFESQFRVQAISLLLVIFVGGMTVSNLLHPYTSIIIAYCIAFYYSLSLRQTESNEFLNHKIK